MAIDEAAAETASTTVEQNIVSPQDKSSEVSLDSAATEASSTPWPSPPPPKTTDHKKQKRDSTETRIGPGKWIKVTHGDSFHVLSPNQREHIPQDIGNSYPLFGKVIGGSGNKTAKEGWDIQLDILPVGDNKVMNVMQSKLSMLAPGENEKCGATYDSIWKAALDCKWRRGEKKKLSPMNNC